MKYSKTIKEKAKQLACQNGNLLEISQTKGMPSMQTLKKWAKKEGWELAEPDKNALVVGRNKRFETPEQLKNELRMYFNSIEEEVWDEYIIDGRSVWRPKLNKDGDPIYRLVKAPTITGICLFLKIGKSTWYNYIGGKFDTELDSFSDVAKMASINIEEFNFQNAYDEKKRLGALWVLERQFKYHPKAEIKSTQKAKLEDYFVDE